MKERVFLDLGSNLGDRLGHLERALRELGGIVEIEGVSPIVETRAVGMAEDAPDFLNAVVEIRTAMEPAELLARCLALEAKAGRVRSGEGSGGRSESEALAESRPLDIDLLFFGDRIARKPGLDLPHPGWSERSFVLRPLQDLAPDFRDPVSGKTVRDVCREQSTLLDEATVVAEWHSRGGGKPGGWTSS